MTTDKKGKRGSGEYSVNSWTPNSSRVMGQLKHRTDLYPGAATLNRYWKYNIFISRLTAARHNSFQLDTINISLRRSAINNGGHFATRVSRFIDWKECDSSGLILNLYLLLNSQLNSLSSLQQFFIR